MSREHPGGGRAAAFLGAAFDIYSAKGRGGGGGGMTC